jgi:hypothetical protein
MNENYDRNYLALRQEGIRTLDSYKEIQIPTETAQRISCCTLEYEAGTNSYQGGDGGHGCRTYLRLEKLDAASWEVWVNGVGTTDCDRLEIIFSGYDELDAIKSALKFMLTTLEKQSPKAEDAATD